MLLSRAVRLLGTLLFLGAVSAPALAQSTAVNGSIEGVVKDSTGAVLPGVTVTVTNLDNGATRSAVTNEDGLYRASLLSLGSYKVVAELNGFKRLERSGVTLSAGQTAVVGFSMEVGGVEETVSVTAESPIAEPSKIDLGRTIGETEIRNLPLVSRNPYNFAFLQPNVTGYENNEFGVARINANGSQMHTNYQIDGNTNTQKDRAGLRMLPVSEIMVREVKVVTNGFAPEFGQTTGMVYNAITPSGSNDIHGSGSFRFRRKDFSARPFYLSPTAPKPDTHVNNWTATLGGPIQKDKWHYYFGYEFVDRDLSADRVITVSPANVSRLGLDVGEGVMPATQSVNFILGKTDYQISPSHKLTGRYLYFKNDSPFNVGGGLNTLDRGTDFADKMDSASVQLVSTLGSSKLNELRLQYANRHQFRVASNSAIPLPAVVVSGVANFGAPVDGTQSAGFDFTQGIWQVIDNFTWIKGRHSLKAGVDLQFVDDDRINTLRRVYTFPNVDAFLSAANGVNPLGYTNVVADLGNPAVSYNSGFHSFFVQDDFQLTSALKVLFGVRYDIFDIPSARQFAANPLSQNFKVDKNNWAPRVGAAWSLDPESRTVVRASMGVMYQPPLLNFYEDAIQRNGDPRLFSVTLTPASAGAPAYPNAPSVSTPRQSIAAISEDFATQYAWLSNVQVERALTNDIAVAVGYVNAIGRNLPLLVDTNLVPTAATLADGRPVYSSSVSAATRVNPAFDHIDVFSSLADSTYNAMTVTLTKRMSHGYLVQATYTLAKGEDNSPLTGTYVVGSGDDRLSDPSTITRDTGVTPFNQTHTFSMSTVLAPQVDKDGALGAILNNNQVGIIVQANSGLPFNIRSNLDLNGDGVTSDRPLGIDRNTGRLGRVFYVDLRYSRFVPFHRDIRGEFFVEGKNIFNTVNLAGITRVITTDAAGNPTVPIATEFPTASGFGSGASGYDQRAFQMGFKVLF